MLDFDRMALRRPMLRQHFCHEAAMALLGFGLRAKERDLSLKQAGIACLQNFPLLHQFQK